MTDSPASTPASPSPSPGRDLLLIALSAVLTLVALGVAGYLSLQSLTGGAVAGCGGDSGCGAVLASPWAKVGPVPVSLLGMVTYLAVLLGLGLRFASRGSSRLGDGLLLLCAPLMLLAAAWFIYIQAVKLEEFCGYCMTDHGLGVVLGILLLIIVLGSTTINPKMPLALGVLGVAGLIAVQTLAPAADDTRSTDNLFVDRDGDKTIDGRRHISMFGGELQFVLRDELYLGDPQADQVVGLVFDYACPHCRALHLMFDEAIAEDPSRFAVVALPITIDPAHNPHTFTDNARFEDSYKRAKLALAVAAVDREKWLAFDRWMFSPESIDDFPRSLDDARAKAVELVGEAALSEQLADESLARHEAILARNMDLMGLIPEDERLIPVVTAPGAPRHLTERFYEIDTLNKLLADAASGLKAQDAAEPQ